MQEPATIGDDFSQPPGTLYSKEEAQTGCKRVSTGTQRSRQLFNLKKKNKVAN